MSRRFVGRKSGKRARRADSRWDAAVARVPSVARAAFVAAGRRASGLARRGGRRAVVGVTALAVVLGAAVTVVLVAGTSRVAATEAFDVAGDPFDATLDGIEPGKRPKAVDGVTLDDPSEPPSAVAKRPSAKPTEVCKEQNGEGDKNAGDREGDGPLDVLVGASDGTEICVAGKTRQSDDIPDVDPLTLADGYDSAPDPNKQPAPVEDPTDLPSGDPADDPTDTPSGGPSDTPTGEPSDDPNDQPSDEPSDKPSDQPSSSDGAEDGPGGDDAATSSADRRTDRSRPAAVTAAQQHGVTSTIGDQADARGSPRVRNTAQTRQPTSAISAVDGSVGSDPVARSISDKPAGAVRAAATPSAGEYLSPNWVQLNPSAQPAASNDAAMAYDVARQQIVRFGGRDANGAALAQTWVWNGLAWVQKSPATSPPARYRSTMAWDVNLGKLVMFGGQSGATGWLNDVWAWDGTTWAQVAATGTAPSARAGAVMAYDTTRAALVVFGGTNSTGARNDTFQLKTTGTPPSTTTAWTQIQANGVAGAPPARFDAGLAFSASTNQMVLFGGATSCGSGTCATVNDTWILGPTAPSWTSKNPTHKPASRASHAMALDPGLGVVPAGTGVDPSKGAVVMFGGISYDGTSPTLHNDTWAWTGEDWAKAVGIASPTGRAGMSMASDGDGQMIIFGGVSGTGATVLEETWAYDSTLPVLELDVTGASGGTPEEPIFWAGDVAEIEIKAHNVGVAAITDITLTSALEETLLAAGSIIKLDNAALPTCTGLVTVLCSLVSDLTASITRINIPVGSTRVGDLLAAVAGTQRGCELIDIPAIASQLTGASAEVRSKITVCGGGLGLEKWWTYDTTDLGGGGKASVNAANGNLVVQQADMSPVQTRGRLALGVSRVYNSQGHMSETMGDPLGIGWQFDLGATGSFAGGFGSGGFPILPNIQTVLQPLSMPYFDRDGTRHTFRIRSVGATVGDINLPIDLTAGGGGVLQQILRLLNLDTTLFPLVSTVTGREYERLCLDQAYTGPPGSNMYLFRYIGSTTSGCGNAASEEDVVKVGWSLVRPDRVRYDYDYLGRIVSVTDPAGQQIKYGYETLQSRGPTQIWTGSCGQGETCPSMSIDYTAPNAPEGRRHVKVTDSAGRITSYLIRLDGLFPYLEQVWEPGNPLPEAGSNTDAKPSWSYTYSSAQQACPGSDPEAKTVGQLCSATNPLGHTTTFAYTPAPIGPDRVLEVTDRRGNDNNPLSGDGDGTSKGLSTRYSWTDHSTDDDAPPVQVTADKGAPNQVEACSTGTDTTCQRVRYTGIDDWGRIAEVAEGDSGGSYIRQTGYFWDGLGESGGIESCSMPLNSPMNHNLCQTLRKAKPTTGQLLPEQASTASVNGVTVHDQAVAYTYGTLGQTLREKVLLDASQPWTDANSSITTWGSHDQYFDANGDQRVFTNYVRGNGNINTSAVGTQYVAAVDADNPHAYWRLGDPSGSTMTARTGPNGYYGTGVGLGAPGVIGDNSSVTESVTSTGAVVTPLNGFAYGTTATTSDFTVEGWQKTTDTTFQERAFAWGSSNAFAQVGRNFGGYPMIYLASDVAASKSATVYSPISIADGEWHHVVYTYDGSGTADGLAIWVDGVEQAVVVYDNDLNGEFSASPTNASTATGGPGSSLDELAIYSRVLESGRIVDHYKAGFGGNPVEADTLYAVTDQTQELPPRGNTAANADNWGDYLTTTRRDLPPNGTLASTNKPGDVTICGTATRGNTGVVCEVDTPSSAGVAAGDCTSPTANMPANSPAAPTSAGYTHTCVTYEYNAAGQRTLMKSAKAHEENLPDVTEYKYYDDSKTGCDGAAQANCDLSGTVSAGGWLKAVIDPKGEKTIFAYDAAGNIARTWERNATHGIALGDTWSTPGAPPSPAFIETVNATPITSDSLSVSNTALIAIAPDGTVSGSGTNASGELGDSTTTTRSEPVAARAVTNVVQVALSATGNGAGCVQTLYLTGDGTVWQAGSGQSTPTLVAGLKDIIQIAAGGCHNLALDAQGRLWSWGSNDSGQLGKGTIGGVLSGLPTAVLDNVSTIAAGSEHSLAVKTDGTLWAWGSNNNGQLGFGNTTTHSSPTQVPDTGANSLSGVRSISGGVNTSYALTRDGKAWAWGANNSGDLGLGDTSQRMVPTRITTIGDGTTAGAVKEIIGASGGAAALMSDGTVRVWGINNIGQLGGAAPGTSTSPVAVPGLSGQTALAGGWATWVSADKAGEVTIWGATGNRQRGDTTNPTTTATPTTAKLNISPYRLPKRQLRGTRDATGNLTTQATDRLGQVRRTRPGRGNEVRTAAFDKAVGYDAAGRPTRSTGAQHRSPTTVATVVYDPYGNAVKTIDARGMASRASFDAVNRQLTSESTRGEALAAGAYPDTEPTACLGRATSTGWTSAQDGHVICVTSTTYDGLDQQITATDGAGQTTRTTYDAAGRKLEVKVPRGNNGYASVSSRWNYDVDGNIVDFCPPREFDISVDAQNERREPDASGSCTSTGKLSTHYVIDRAGRVTTEKRYRGAIVLNTSMRYDADGNTISVTDANGHETTTRFDTLGRRVKHTVPRSATESNSTTWTYDHSGNVTTVNAPGFLSTGTGSDGDLTVNGTTNGASNPFKIPDGAQYRNVTLTNGAHVTAAGTGNGLVFYATGTVDVCSTCVITMTGRGQLGGATAADAANPNPGNGGTKGQGGFNPSGGGGGGHQSDGQPGNAGTGPGLPGLASGSPDFGTVGSAYLNGSGGGGGGGGQSLTGGAGKGGNGGGYIRITADTVIVDGTITAAGQNGVNSSPTSGGAGGGGAGGGIWISAFELDLASPAALDVSGGAGGSGSGTAPNQRNGGNGAAGRVRIDGSSNNAPIGAYRGSADSITAISYDTANRPLDTLEGALTSQADPTLDHNTRAAPDASGLANTRTRAFYNADGQIAAILPPQAFSNAASLTAPNTDTARRIDYDLDGKPTRTYSPRYDNTAGSTVTSLGAGDDGGTGVDQQVEQCTTNRTTDSITGLAAYGTNVGVCKVRATYDPAGNLKRQYLPTSSTAGSGSDNGYLEYSYTGDNLVAAVTGPDPSNSDSVSSTARVTVASNIYDGAGRLRFSKNALGHVTQTSYTADGLVAATATQSYTDAQSNLQVTEIIENLYDAGGNIVDIKNPKGDHTTQTWTTDGFQKAIHAPGPNTGTAATTVYTYDNVGNPIEILTPRTEALAQNDAQRKPIINQFTHDNLILATHTPIDESHYRSVAYRYLPAGLKSRTEIATCNSGNVANCVRGNTAWNSGGSLKLGYGPNGRVNTQTGREDGIARTITTTYAQHGGLIQVNDPISDITTTATYYLDGTLRTAGETGTGGAGNQNTYAYDASGQLTMRSDETGATGVTGGTEKTTSYAYSQAGLVKAMTSQVLGAATAYTYDQAGRPLQAATPNGTGAHINQWSWQPNNALAGAKTIDNSVTISQYEYDHDNNRNITKEAVTGQVGPHTFNYTYTPAEQLKDWTTGGFGALTKTEWTYDASNNRTSEAVTAAGTTETTAWTYNLDNSIAIQNGPKPVVLGSDPDKRTYVYTDEGLLQSDGCNVNTYDEFDRLAKTVLTLNNARGCGQDTKTTEFTYDGLDRQRTAAVTDPNNLNGDVVETGVTKSAHDGLSTNLIGQIDAANGNVSKPEVLYQLDANGVAVGYDQTSVAPGKAFLDTDGRGNVTALHTKVTSGTGELGCAVVYSPYGNPYDGATGATNNGMCRANGSTTVDNNTGNSQWYRGLTRDGSTGTYQMGTRTYDANTGAFKAPDAYRVASPSTDLSVVADPLTANTYGYVNGNPINLSDPDGHRAIDGSGNELSPCVSNPSSCTKEAAVEARAAYKALLASQATARAEAKVAERIAHTFGLAHGEWLNIRNKTGFCDDGGCDLAPLYDAWVRQLNWISEEDRTDLENAAYQEMLHFYGGAALEDPLVQGLIDLVATLGYSGVRAGLRSAGAAFFAAGVRGAAASGVDITGARFAQTTVREGFQKGGLFEGRTITDVVGDLRSGALAARDVPINVVVRDGNTLILNTRSATALTRAGVPRSSWNVLDRTGDDFFEGLLDNQLRRNGLDSNGYVFPK